MPIFELSRFAQSDLDRDFPECPFEEHKLEEADIRVRLPAIMRGGVERRDARIITARVKRPKVVLIAD